MLEPLGKSQVLNYLLQLNEDFEYHLVSMEKDYKNIKTIQNLREFLLDKNIYYYPTPYKTSRLEKKINLFRLYSKANSVLINENIKNLHCRAYFPTFIAYILKKKYNINYLFDTRSFGLDERADIKNISRNDVFYRFLKKIEKELYLHASGINMLSYNSKQIILNKELFETNNKIPPITVIPTCVDLDKFKLNKKNYKNTLKIGYVGNVAGWYDFDKTLEVVNKIGEIRDYEFLIFNCDQHNTIKDKLINHKIPLDKVKLEKVSFNEMHTKLKEVDISVFFIKPLFSKKASAATKLGELLASGIPVITNKGIGDHEYYINRYKVGQIIDINEIYNYDYNYILNKILNIETSKNCRFVAEKYFSLKQGASQYKEFYNKIFNF